MNDVLKTFMADQAVNAGEFAALCAYLPKWHGQMVEIDTYLDDL